MNIRVDLRPNPPYNDVVIMIDVLRTCSVAPILFANGLKELHISTSLKQARILGEKTNALLLGERGGLPPEGFNHGNSPAELRSMPLEGSAVLISENAPATLPLLDGADHLLLGSFYNADAVSKHAISLAKDTIYLVCCGLWQQEDLDDSITAGFIANHLYQLNPEAKLSGGAILASGLLRSFPDPLEAFWRSNSGHYLRKLNFHDDLAVASLISQTDHVPVLKHVQTLSDGTVYSFESSLAQHGSR